MDRRSHEIEILHDAFDDSGRKRFFEHEIHISGSGFLFKGGVFGSGPQNDFNAGVFGFGIDADFDSRILDFFTEAQIGENEVIVVGIDAFLCVFQGIAGIHCHQSGVEQTFERKEHGGIVIDNQQAFEPGLGYTRGCAFFDGSSQGKPPLIGLCGKADSLTLKPLLFEVKQFPCPHPPFRAQKTVRRE